MNTYLLRKVRVGIQRLSSTIDADDAAEFILQFYMGVIHLLRAFDRIQGIFLYFDKHFLVPKMGFDGRFPKQPYVLIEM